MKCIIAGSRCFDNSYYSELVEVMRTAEQVLGARIDEVISGGAAGTDRLGERWAIEQDRRLTVLRADWDKLGPRAGMVRNREMADYAGPGAGCVVLWDGHSKGTRNMIKLARAMKLKLVLHMPLV